MEILEIDIVSKKYARFIMIYALTSIGISLLLCGAFFPVGMILLIITMILPVFAPRVLTGPFIEKGNMDQAQASTYALAAPTSYNYQPSSWFFNTPIKW